MIVLVMNTRRRKIISAARPQQDFTIFSSIFFLYASAFFFRLPGKCSNLKKDMTKVNFGWETRSELFVATLGR